MHSTNRLAVTVLTIGAVVVLGAGAPVRGQPTDALRDAVSLGQTHDEVLFESFNKSYNLSPSGTIERAEIITEFRRGVLIVRERAQAGDYSFSWDALSKAMVPWKGLVTFVVQARLNPMNTFAKEPAYDLYVSTGPSSGPIASNGVKRQPIYPQGGGPGSGFVSVRLEASFPSAAFTRSTMPQLVVTDEKAETLWQARLDLSRYR
jgi:hypothetical protein